MEWINVNFSVDLVEAALRHLNFLDDVSSVESLLTGELLDHALRRYEQLWLPLATSHRHTDIVPPVDVGWLWYIHMMSPLAYKRDCRKLVGRTLDHSFKDSDDIIPCANRTVELWYKTYPKSGYNVIRNGEYVERKQHYVTSDASKLSVSIIGNARSYLQFCYQVSLPHFRDKKYLEGALKRYKQFLCMKRLAPEKFLTPCVDIILMWYTHMCYPVAYAKDLTNICGRILDNNVKVKYTLMDENYIAARDKTSEMWSRVSAEEFIQPGTKLRASVNNKEIFPVTLDDLKSCCVLDYDVYLTNVDLIGHPEKTKFELKIYLVDTRNNWKELVSLKGNKRVWSISTKFLFNTHRQRALRVMLLRKSKLWCFKGYTVYANGSFDLRDHLQEMGSNEHSLDAEVAMETTFSDSIRVDIDGSVTNATPILCELRLRESSFERRSTKASLLRRTWGNYRMPKNTLNDAHECYMAVHSFKNQEGVESFRCLLLHIPDLIRSGVEVFFRNKLVATSYVIGSSHLPYPNQVQWSDLSISFDPEIGERAMLLRNHNGDWAICVARWVEESENSHLDFRIMKLGQRNKLQRVEVHSVDVQFQSFNANLYTGSVQINPINNTVAENLATLWSMCILYVLCAPKDVGRYIKLRETGPTDVAAPPEEVSQKRLGVPERNCKFLVAAGLLTEVPSNEVMLKEYGSLKYDILMDAQDVIIAEQKLDRQLQEKESKIRRGDHDRSPKKLKKKKSSSCLKYISSSMDSTGPVQDPSSNVDPTEDPKQPTLDSKQREQQERKRKRMKKKKSSGLDDMLSVSDDSFTKEDIEQLDKVLVTDDKGRKVVKKKDSNYLENVKLLRKDSLDQEVKDDEEYYGTLENNKLKALGERVEHSDLIADNQLAIEIKEHTTIIKDVAERKREDLVSRHGDKPTSFASEDITKPDV